MMLNAIILLLLLQNRLQVVFDSLAMSHLDKVEFFPTLGFGHGPGAAPRLIIASWKDLKN